MAFAEEFFLLRHDLFGTALQQRLPPVDVFHDAAGLVQLLRKIEAHFFIRRLEQQIAVIHAEIQRGQTAAVHLHFQLLVFPGQHQDIGRIRSWNPASGRGEATVEYYDQTLSVGIDAAIGLGTTELRKKTGLTGAPLYTLSGLEQFGLRYSNYPMTVSFDGAPAERVRAIIMAIQLGPTYGSGYRICPDADPCDGILDVCYACGPVPRAVALPMFLSAKDGHHTKLPPVRMRRCRHAELTFEEPDYPIQADGEPVVASRIEVDILPAALEVWHPTR